MICESELLDMLPKGSFLREYTVWAGNQSHVSMVHQCGTMLSVLASLCPTDLHVPFAGRKLYPVLYVLALGDSGAGKSWAISSTVEFAQNDGGYTRAGPDVASPQALVKVLSERPRQLQVMGEFGQVLERTWGDKNTLWNGYRKRLTQLHDCTPIDDRLVDAAASRSVRKPRMSLIAGCTPEDLDQFTGSSDWRGGLLGRFLLLPARRERELLGYFVEGHPDSPRPQPKRRARLGQRLRAFAAAQGGPCAGLSIPSQEYMEAWQARLADLYEERAAWDSAFASSYRRLDAHALRVALVQGYEAVGSLSPAPWEVDLASTQFACALIEAHFRCLVEIIDRLATTPFERLRRSIMDVVLSENVACKTAMYQRIRPRPLKRDLDNALGTMVEAGELRKLKKGYCLPCLPEREEGWEE